MRFCSKYFFLAGYIFLISSCAQVVTPGGGPKDTTPPRVIKYIPDSAALNFKSKNIGIFFNEYIQANDVRSQLIISPPLNKTPDINVKDKTLNIAFDKEEVLKPSTTYVMSFGSSVKDVNEGNAIEDFKYIFSTGSYIDSLSISGKVQTAFDHKVENGILVMLYKNTDDSVIYKNLPDYFSKTRADGSYKITNLSAGKYKIIALKDKNANYKYDEGESIAFVDSLIELPYSRPVSLELFTELPKKIYLKKHIYNSYGKIDFYFSKGADSIIVKPLNYTFNPADIILDYSANKDSLTYWFRNIDNDSLILQLSNGYKVLDTIRLKLINKEEAIKSKKNPLQFKMLSSPNNSQGFDLGQNLNIMFNAPIVSGFSLSVDTTVLVLKEDSVLWNHKNNKVKYNFSFREGINKLTYTLCFSEIGSSSKSVLGAEFNSWKENTKYELFIPPATLTDFFGFTNDSINIKFKTREETYYGSLKFKIVVPDGKYILQLLDENEKLVRENYISNSQTIDYMYLTPQTYKLKLIYDINNDHKWSNGNLSKKIQPEKVIYNNETINIRSNWDLDLTWEVK